MQVIRAVVRDGKIELPDLVRIPDGTEVLVTPVTDDVAFWNSASQPALDSVWDNVEDDVYTERLKE